MKDEFLSIELTEAQALEALIEGIKETREPREVFEQRAKEALNSFPYYEGIRLYFMTMEALNKAFPS